MRLGFLAWATWTMLLGVAQAAANPTVTATVDRNTVSLQDEIILTVTVEGSRHAQITLPPLEAFNVHERGQSTQVRIVNGSLSTQVSYAYALTPSRVGTFTVGAVSAMVGTKPIVSDPFEVTVTAAATASTDTSDIFLTADISELSPVVGQQLVYTWRLFHRVHIANGRVSLPTFEGFSARDLGPQRDYQTHIDGQQYTVTEMRRALFPQDVGELTVPGSRLDIDVAITGGSHSMPGNPFADILGQARHRTRTLTTPPLAVTVRPLPPPPPDFTDLVGHFSLDAQVAQTHLQLGDSTTLTVTVKGEGDVERIVEPILGEVPGLKVYSERPITESHLQDSAIVGAKVFKKALVPTKAGQLELPSIHLTYFDPSTHTYQTVTTPIYMLHVSPNPNAAPAPQASQVPAVVHKTDVKVLLDDILPPYRRQDALRPAILPSEKVGLALLFGLPPLLYGIAWFFRRNFLRTQDVIAARRRSALKRSLEASAAMHGALTQGDMREAAALGSRAVRIFVGDRLNVEGLALTPSEARRLLAKHGAAPSLCVTVEGILQRCEAAQYGAASLSTPGGNSVEELRNLLKQLDASLPA